MIKRSSFWLGGILLVALLLRGIALDVRPLAYDDAFSFFLARQPLASIIQGTAADTMPPLYYFLLHGWMKISESVWFMRFLSVILSLGAIWFLYHLVKQLAGRNAALWSAFLAAISPLQIYHAQDMRMYALMELCQLAFLYFFVRIWQTYGSKITHRRFWVGLVISGVAAMYTHNLAVFGLIIPDCFLLLRREWKLLGRLIIAQISIGVLALPWLVYLPGQLAKVQTAFWTPEPGLVEVVQTIIMSSSNLPMPDSLQMVGIIASVLALALVIFEALRARKGESQKAITFFTIAVLVVPVLLFLVSYVMRPVFVPRQFLISMMAYLGLAGIVLSQIKRRAMRMFLLLCFLVACLAALPYHYAYQLFPRSPYQQAMEYLSDEVHESDVVVHDNKLSFFPSRYYDPDLFQVFLPDVPGSANDTLALASQKAMGIYPEVDLQTAITDYKRIYFVVFQVTIEEYKRMNLSHPQLEWLQANYRQIDYRFFNDLNIYLFEH